MKGAEMKSSGAWLARWRLLTPCGVLRSGAVPGHFGVPQLSVEEVARGAGRARSVAGGGRIEQDPRPCHAFQKWGANGEPRV